MSANQSPLTPVVICVACATQARVDLPATHAPLWEAVDVLPVTNSLRF